MSTASKPAKHNWLPKNRAASANLIWQFFKQQPQPSGLFPRPAVFALALACAVLVSFPGVILGMRTFVFRDFSLFSYPVAYFQRECFWRGELPLWNPYNCCGIPFLAQWNTMPLYPPALCYLLLPLTWSLPFFCLLHMYWGGLGMYFLARRWMGSNFAAAVAGVVFAFNGLTLNFLMWPSHLATFSWIPWVLWLAPQGWQEGGKKLVTAVMVTSLQMLAGGPESIFFTWLILAAIATGELLTKEAPRHLLLLRAGTVFLLTVLICAPQLLPFLQLLAHSERDAQYAASAHPWSMPFWGWANFLVPMFRTSPTPPGVFMQNGQYWTSSYYVGIGTVLLGGLAIRRVREWRFLLISALVLIGLLLSWGDANALFSALQRACPVLGFVRYPIKFVILALALAPLVAGYGLAALEKQQAKGLSQWLFPGFLLLLIGIIIAVDQGDAVPSQSRHATLLNGVGRAAILIAIASCLHFLFHSSGQRRAFLGTGLLFLFWLDFRTHMPNQNPTVDPVVYATASAPTANDCYRFRELLTAEDRAYLSQNGLSDSAANLRRNRSVERANVNLLDHTEQLDGFFSLTPKNIYEVLQRLSTEGSEQRKQVLDFAGVVTTSVPWRRSESALRPGAMPLLSFGQAPTYTNDTAALAHLFGTLADLHNTVYLEPHAHSEASWTGPAEGSCTLKAHSNTRLVAEVSAQSGGWLVIAQTLYPGWEATVDGKPTKLWKANYAFQALSVPPGTHTIELVYKERLLWAGLISSGLGLSGCGALLWLEKRKIMEMTRPRSLVAR